MALSVATWNVNSLKVRLPHLLDWLGSHATDIVCLQETKLTDDRFPVAELQQAGYCSVFAGQKTYNGVAILLREAAGAAATDVQVNLPEFADEQKRLVAVTVDGLRIVNGYFPNGQAVGSEKFAYKLAWLAALTGWLRGELARHEQLLLAGDFNIAPEPACRTPSACSSSPSAATRGGTTATSPSAARWACESTTSCCRRAPQRAAPPARSTSSRAAASSRATTRR